MSDLQSEIGKRIQNIRTKYYSDKKVNAATFADLLGENKFNIGNYERGIASVPNRVLVEIYKLGFNVNWILTGEGSPYNHKPLSEFGKVMVKDIKHQESRANASLDLTEQIKDAVRAAAGDIAAMIKADLNK